MSILPSRQDPRKPKAYTKKAECRVDGCGNLVSANNRNRFCEEHLHDIQHCGCFSCRRKRKGLVAVDAAAEAKTPSALQAPPWA